jgi:uncharacterized protein YbjT (DUF2867 family)
MKILLFGATGSAGGSVLRVCLEDPAVEEVRAVVRRPIPIEHEKLQVFIHGNFQDYTGVEAAFAGVDACLFCLGISATQVSGEEEYRRITYGFAVAAARALRAQSPEAGFHFISGQGTSLSSRFMWARVKAETERELMDLVDAVCWRPAAIDGAPSDHAPRAYKVFRPLFRLLRPFRSLYVSGEDLGRAMLRAVTEGMGGRILENAEIRDLAEGAPILPSSRGKG